MKSLTGPHLNVSQDIATMNTTPVFYMSIMSVRIPNVQPLNGHICIKFREIKYLHRPYLDMKFPPSWIIRSDKACANKNRADYKACKPQDCMKSLPVKKRVY